MATITDNQDGSLTVLLSTIEYGVFVGLPRGQIDAYLTLWLNERSKTVFQERFDKLSEQDKTDVMTKLMSVDAVKG